MVIDKTEELIPLTQEERSELLRIALQAIGATLGVASPPTLERESPALVAPGGAFVSVYCAEQLRGCVGTVAPEEPLHVTVAAMARAAAREDTRFAPLAPTEWPRIRTEISRLGVPRRVRPEEVIPGYHGVYLVRGPARGLLLPQVAARMGWSREQLLREVCHKAGVAPETWIEPATELLVFVAEVFGTAP